jgi:hypothetical protein
MPQTFCGRLLLRTYLLFCLAFAAFTARADISAPENWRRESFPFPLAFASSIPYQGKEEVRFTPGWSRFSTDEGFSYVFMWDIKRVPMEAAHLERGLAVYFDGLMEQVARGRKLEELPVHAAVVLHPMAAPKGWKEAYAGAIHTWNAFDKGEDLRLNIEIAHRDCPGERMQIFFAVSKGARAAPVWGELREARRQTAC